MANLYCEAADMLRKQAEAVLQRKNIPSLMDKIGKIYFTGSYALNLMTWNDIDMQLVIKNDLSPTRALMQILDAFIHEKDLVKVTMINFTGEYKPHYPRGFCLSIKINVPDLGGIWKFDMWILEKQDFQKNQALLLHLKNAMTDQTRKLILEIKHELMQQSGRVPKRGNHY